VFNKSDKMLKQALRYPPLVLLHGRNIHSGDQFSEILDQAGTVIDHEAYGNLPHYPDVQIPRGLSLNWIKVNPDIYTFLIDRQTRKPAGYINAMPVDDALYTSIRSGKMVDNAVPASGIVPFLGPETVKIYVMSIAIAKKYRRWGNGILQQAYMQLLTGFLDKLAYYAKNCGVRATHFLATAWTPEGYRLCQFFAMTEVGKDPFGDSIFELDLEALQSAPAPRLAPALKRLLNLYKQIRRDSRARGEGTID
jgi:hypothetical protein